VIRLLLRSVSPCPTNDNPQKRQLKLPRALPQWVDIEMSPAPHAATNEQRSTICKLKRNHSYANNHSLGTTQRMEDFHNRLSNLSTLFGRPLRRTNGHGREDITLADWMPLADITEDEKEYLIKAELPRAEKGGRKVTVENGVLTISGERKFEKEEKKRKFHRVERGYGTFMRSFTLPDDADGNKVKAEIQERLAHGTSAQERTRQAQTN